MKHDVGSSSTPLLETIETIEEEEYILLRFPCFDFFRNVHLCEQRVGGEPSPSGVVFNAEGVSFSAEFPPSRSVESPLVFLNAGTPTAMGFRGSWEELAEREGGQTNRVILHLTRRAKGEGDAEKVEKEGEEEGREKGGKQQEPPSAVSSLFCHLQEGVTADEKRQREEQRAKEAGDWVYDKVITPSAVLVMTRIS
ncbi:unnamed protein product [Phytomonas sp. EM1]|nr:unnamed protein product [Phytomonas sp. EM1]|eukprot:CCW60979.1 unnamed protein product [Phytomonas sp. isolate EM1]